MAKTTKEVILTIRNRFDEVLESKTGWGKNELKKAHDNIIIDVLSEIE